MGAAVRVDLVVAAGVEELDSRPLRVEVRVLPVCRAETEARAAEELVVTRSISLGSGLFLLTWVPERASFGPVTLDLAVLAALTRERTEPSPGGL